MPNGSNPTHADLLEQQAFLRRLARSLVSDAHNAEDLAQDATLAALERAPASATSLRSWLARVLRNRAINAGVSEERRRAREQAAHHPAPPRSPDELEAHFQVQRRVMEAVDRLEEPYRTAILLRYYRDLAPTAIAEQLGVPVATVKSRLARALARLRAELDDGDPRGSHAWIAVLAGGLGELHRPAAATALAAGGVAMGLKLAFSTAAACGALVLGGWWLLRPVEPTTEENALAPEASLAAPTALPETQRTVLREAQIESERAALPFAEAKSNAQATPPMWSLTLALRGLDEQDRGPISIAIHSGSEPLPVKPQSHELAESLTLDLDAFFENIEARPKKLTLLLDHPAYLPAQSDVPVPEELQDPTVRSGQLTAVVDLVRASAIVTGKIELASGFPHVEPRVAIFSMQAGKPAKNPIEDGRLDAEGRFRLRADGAMQHAVVVHDERTTNFHPRIASEVNQPALRPETRVLALDAGEQLDIGILSVGEGESIEGHVVPVGGMTRVPGRVRALFEAKPTTSWQNLDWIGGQFELHGQLVDLTAEGEFRISGLAPLAYAMSTVPKHKGSGNPIWFRDRSKSSPVVTASAIGVELQLDRVMVTIEVRAEGLPVDHAGLSYEVSGADSSGTTSTNSDGMRTFELDLGKDLTFEASDPRYGSKKLELSAEDLLVSDHYVIELEGPAVEPAQIVVVPNVRDPAHLENVLLDISLFETSMTPPERLERERKSPARNAVGGSESVSVTPRGKWPVRARDGEARILSDLRPGRYLVCVSPRASKPEQSCFLLAEAFEVDLPAGQRVVHDWRPELGGVVRLEFSGTGSASRAEILGTDDVSVDARFQTSSPDSYGLSTHGGSCPITMGAVDVRPSLPRGPYNLRIHMADKTIRSIPFQIEAGRVTDVVVDLSTL
jgi:RNA polymerase sigma-70 factor (ECF subfamily)